jgi:hypothetical protein
LQPSGDFVERIFRMLAIAPCAASRLHSRRDFVDRLLVALVFDAFPSRHGED